MTPKLRLDILKEIKAKVSLLFVLHGGSNNPDEEIGEAVKLGINKINIFSDIKVALEEVDEPLKGRFPPRKNKTGSLSVRG